MKHCHLNELSYNHRDDIDVITSEFQMIYENLIKLLESEWPTQTDVQYGYMINGKSLRQVEVVVCD